MKTTLYSILAAAACAMAFGQTAYTNPVGYTSQTLAPSSSNIIGINVLKPTLVSGLVTVVSGADVTASAINFTTALPTGKRCVLEITSGTAAGTVQDFITWSGSTITLPAAVTGLAIGDKISVRAANTLQELFPAGTLVVSGNLNASAADKVWIQQANGSYIRYFVKGGLSNPGWHTTANGSTIGETLAITTDIPVLYTDGLIVQTGASPISPLVISGEVKKTSSNALVKTGIANLISVVPPVGLTLFTSGLATQLQVSGNLNASAADKIWIPQYDISGMFTGTYIRYFMKGGLSNPGWHTTPNGSTIGETLALSVDINLTPGTYIQRVGASDVEIKFNVPSSYPSF
jgi:uncharacterized protein (TIGR02597 family)